MQVRYSQPGINHHFQQRCQWKQNCWFRFFHSFVRSAAIGFSRIISHSRHRHCHVTLNWKGYFEVNNPFVPISYAAVAAAAALIVAQYRFQPYYCYNTLTLPMISFSLFVCDVCVIPGTVLLPLTRVLMTKVVHVYNVRKRKRREKEISVWCCCGVHLNARQTLACLRNACFFFFLLLSFATMENLRRVRVGCGLCGLWTGRMVSMVWSINFHEKTMIQIW